MRNFCIYKLLYAFKVGKPVPVARSSVNYAHRDFTPPFTHLHDEDSRQAMLALAKTDRTQADAAGLDSTYEGNLRAKGQSRIDETLQVPEVKELVTTLSSVTERAGFEPAVRVYTHTTV